MPRLTQTWEDKTVRLPLSRIAVPPPDGRSVSSHPLVREWPDQQSVGFTGGP
jgi:hypothetical protein